MKIAVRTFLNNMSVSDPAFAVLTATSSGESQQSFSLTVSFGYGSVTIHNSADSLEQARDMFLNKITKVREALRAALDADRVVPKCVRVWLNGDGAMEREYTGNICWMIDKNSWIISLSDCHRSIRVHTYTDEDESEASSRYCKEQRNKVENLLKFIDKAVALINNGR